jgi:hypothetical protein
MGVHCFCSQSNENDPAAGRTCHWAVTEFPSVRFRSKGAQRDAPYRLHRRPRVQDARDATEFDPGITAAANDVQHLRVEHVRDSLFQLS